MSIFIINPYVYATGGISCAYPVTGTTTQYGTQSGTNAFYPAYGLYNYSYSAWIILQSEIGAGKQLNGIDLTLNSYTVPFTYLNQELWIGHITQSAFAASPQVNHSDLTLTNWTKVKNAHTYTVSNNGAWQTTTFDVNFCYNGTSNLLIGWKNYDGAWTSGYGNASVRAATNRGMYAYSDPGFPTGVANARISTIPIIRLRY